MRQVEEAQWVEGAPPWRGTSRRQKKRKHGVLARARESRVIAERGSAAPVPYKRQCQRDRNQFQGGERTGVSRFTAGSFPNLSPPTHIRRSFITSAYLELRQTLFKCFPIRDVLTLVILVPGALVVSALGGLPFLQVKETFPCLGHTPRGQDSKQP